MQAEELHQLRRKLPPLALSEDGSSDFRASPLLHRYLSEFGLDFAAEHDGLEHHVGYVNAHGQRVACHYWVPQLSVGTVFVVHDYLDHVGHCRNLVRYAMQNQLAVVLFDLPGHGLSRGEIAQIPPMAELAGLVDSLAERLDDALPAPFHLLGAGFGASIALETLWNAGPQRFDRVVLLAPAIRSARWIARRVPLFLLRRFRDHAARSFSTCSHDRQYLAFARTGDPLRRRTVPLAWFDALRSWEEALAARAPIAREVLIVQGDGDEIFDWSHGRSVLERLLPDAGYVLVPGAFNNLLNESAEYRMRVFAELSKFLPSDQ